MIRIRTSILGLSLRHRADDVGISGVGDGEGAHAEVLSAAGAELDVVASVVVDAGLGEHGVVLDLGLPARRENTSLVKHVSGFLPSSVRTDGRERAGGRAHACGIRSDETPTPWSHSA